MIRYLKDILRQFRRQDLEYLSDLLGRECPARMKKSDLAGELAVYLSRSPSEWMNIIPERDLVLLSLLRETGPDKWKTVYYPDYPSILEYAGLIDCDNGTDPDSVYRDIRISREIYSRVMPCLDDALRSGRTSGRFDRERKMLGLLNLYGILPYESFQERMGEDARLLARNPLLKLCRFYGNDGQCYVCSPCMEDPEEVMKERVLYSEITDYKEFSEEELREAGSSAPLFVFGLGTGTGAAVHAMLQELGYRGTDLLWEEHEIWMCAQDPERNLALFDAAAKLPESALPQEEYDRCIRLIADYANSLPKWRLNGYNSDETGFLKVFVDGEGEEVAPDVPRWEMPRPSISEGYSDLIEKTPELEALMAMMPEGFPFGMAVPHVAEDDPCPCGSGLRYGHCHGRNKS